MTLKLPTNTNRYRLASEHGGFLIPAGQSCPTTSDCQLEFQSDGNLVSFYNGVCLWNSATVGRGVWVVCQEVELWLYIVDGDGNIIWDTSSGPTVFLEEDE